MQHGAFKSCLFTFLFVGGISFILDQSCQLLVFLLSDTNSIWLTDIICLLTAYFQPVWICSLPKRFPSEEFKPTDKEH